MRRLPTLFAAIPHRITEARRIRRTHAELNRLSTDSLLDLGLYRGDLRRIARAAVRAA